MTFTDGMVVEMWWCAFCGEHHSGPCPKHHRYPRRGRLILGYLSKEGHLTMASTPISVPAGTTTVYASLDNYVDGTGAPTTDVAVSGSWTVSNGGSAVADGAGLTATLTLVPGTGTTTVDFSGSDAAGNPIKASNSIVEEAPVVAPAVSADIVLTTTPPAPPAAPAAPAVAAPLATGELAAR